MEKPLEYQTSLYHPKDPNLSRKQGDAWWYLQDKINTEILYGGAAGGGKSYLGCLWHIDNRLRYANTRGLIGRSKIANLEQSTLITLFKVAETLDLQIGKDFKYNSQKHVINWANGSQSILKDLFQYPADPDFISLGSTEYTDAFIDEATEVTEKAVEIVKSRLRWKVQEYNLIPKLLMTCNPSPGWVKDNWIEDDRGKPITLAPYQKYVRALVTDNPDTAYAELYKEQLERMKSPYDKARLLYGDWNAESESQNPFAFQFDPEFHISTKAIHIPQKKLIIAIDFNLNPFGVVFIHEWEDRDGVHTYVFDEASIENGSIPSMIDLIRERYGKVLHNCEITGDAMGRNRDISQRDNASLYDQLRRGLRIGENQVKVYGNPTHENSRSDVNWVLYHSKGRNEFIINPDKCPITVRDFKYVQVDAFGKLLKRDRKDLNQRADMLDCVRYYINTYYRRYIKHIN